MEQLFRNESKDWTGVTVNGKETISTPGHKYYLPETKAWVSAEDLKVGYEVLTSDGEYAIIKAVRPIHYKTPQTTYNFEVADFHTYYVSIGVLVHNEGCGGRESLKKTVDQAKDFLGEDAKVITNKSGDKVFISQDGTRRIRFDINNPSPHQYAHAHIEIKTGKSGWSKSGPIWPKDLPHV